MGLIFNKNQLTCLIAIMETYEHSDESEWWFPVDCDKDYLCELWLPFENDPNKKSTAMCVYKLNK